MAVVTGGDGFPWRRNLGKYNIPAGLAGTIDKDIYGSDFTIAGSIPRVNTAIEAIGQDPVIRWTPTTASFQ